MTSLLHDTDEMPTIPGYGRTGSRGARGPFPKVFVPAGSAAAPIPGYRLLEPLGEGASGDVWRCERPAAFSK